METAETTNGNGKVTALALRPSVQTVAYEPRTSDEAYRMATHFAKSGLLGEIKTPESAFLIMATGADLGIPATTALRTISIVKGKPVLSADLMKAMCLNRKDVCEFFRLVTSDEKIATYKVKRVGDEAVTMSFTMEDALRAKLATKGDDSNYGKYPAIMLRHRAAANIAREVFPDIILGVYCEEEADEIAATAEPISEVREQIDATQARIDGLRETIKACTTVDELTALAPTLKAEPAAIAHAVKLDYQQRKAELTEARGE
jgi:hypothetical protein